jgi:Family of unknown function (DUF5632)/Family of unknown function (DUF5631)
VVAIFGRNTARRRLRRAAQESLKVPVFSAPVDCTPWVTGGVWPAELSAVTADTAPLVRHLKAGLQRIVNSANDELTRIRRAGLTDSARQAQEARILNDARAFALRRVESTVRHLRDVTTTSPAQYRALNGADPDKTQRFKLAPPGPEPHRPAETSAPTTEFRPLGEPDSWTLTTDGVQNTPAAELPTGRPRKLQALRWSESDDAAVRDAITSPHQIETPADASAAAPPRHEPVVPAPSVSMFEPVTPTPVVTEPAVDDHETIPHPVPHVSSESEHQRLQRLLKFVARQEPGLRWAVGSRDDGTTLLVTDLAHGWIPPGIILPADIHLLEPSLRTGTAATLLGQTSLSATYAPGDLLGLTTDDKDTDTSPQPRDLPAVNNLGQVLSKATHGRDGLPRVVNTLAQASAAATDLPTADLNTLQVYLNTSRYQLLAQYPDIDGGLLLNCLLLAATESIATDQQLDANYHFAWFQTLSAPAASS